MTDSIHNDPIKNKTLSKSLLLKPYSSYYRKSIAFLMATFSDMKFINNI